MPLKIRCPHCRRVLVAEDDTAGQRRACPACKRPFDVPLRIPEHFAPEVEMPKCPRCGAEVSPVATFCHKCHADLLTGERLPLGRRLRLLSWRTWLIATFGATVLGLLAFVGLTVYRARQGTAAPPVVHVASVPPQVRELAERLLTAANRDERTAVLNELGPHESQAVPIVAELLAESLAVGKHDDVVLAANRVAAIDVLARHASSDILPSGACLPLLARCERVPRLASAALRARGMWGDTTAADALITAWLDGQQRQVFLTHVVACAEGHGDAGARALLADAQEKVACYEDGLRRLVSDPASGVAERLAAAYWTSWSWLGQQRGEAFAEALGALTKPRQQTLTLRSEDERSAQELLLHVVRNAAPVARPAAAMVLHTMPSARTHGREITAALEAALAGSAGQDQQRIVWALGHWHGERFGDVLRAHPLDVTDAEISEAQRRARPSVPPELHPPYPAPPVLTYRAITPAHQLEGELLRELQGGWLTANAALERWLAADLGCTPRLERFLNPGQRTPDYPALAAALVIVGRYGDDAYRARLELWRGAYDQPAWVRSLAYTVLGRLDARGGQWPSGWPAGLSLGEPGDLEIGQPGWQHFGCVMAAGGATMEQRLLRYRPAPLDVRARNKLLDAAKRCGREP